uniref:PMS1 homolog 1, mismatch repair system component n=1 Tax=Cyprinus carpio TaxID=7962 RepID=A0A8C1RSR9_CYPCA
ITSVLNVVKELVENSLDAGSSSLEVKLENYGLDRIEVRDNGSGINATDVPVMHLKSPATKTWSQNLVLQYSVDHNGRIVTQKPSHLGEGTTVCAANLFKNLPVRRQYYSNSKKCKEELKRVQNLLMAYAVVKPELRITLSHNKAVIWQKSRVSDHRTALMAVLGAASVANMLPIQHHQEQPEIGVDGFFPKPGSDFNSTSSSSPDKTFFVKTSLFILLKQYYNSAQSNKESANLRYPILMMNITIPASTVDVNLTPDKTEVVLQNKEGVLLAVETMLISLYGYSVGDDDLKAGGNRPAVSSVEVPEHTNVVMPTPTTDTSLDDPELLENSPPNEDKQDSELSLSNTANTSSSSISEDWVINRCSNDFDSISSSLPADDVVMNSTSDLNCDSPKASKSDSGPGQESEISAESWSTGKAFSNRITRECLETVKLHVPKTHGDLGGTEPTNMRSSPSKRPSNLISNRSVRQPSSAFSLFEQDTRSQVLQVNPRASPQDVTTAVKERWESLGEEDRKKYESKAEKSLNAYNLQRKRAAEGGGQCEEGKKQMSAESSLNKAQGVKRKAPLANQQALDKLFSSQPSSKRSPAKLSKPLPFSIATLKQSLNLLSYQNRSSAQGLRLVNRLASHGAWVVLCGRKLMVMNPFRVEEALLFKRLLENNILPTVRLQNPVPLTDGVLGGPQYMDVLLNMEKDSPCFNGDVYFTDPRLVANGFEIRMIPGSSSSERHVEVTGMADCMPFLGIGDLREILQAIKVRDAKTVEQCRPLKLRRAVRLARQLPLNLSRADVTNTLCRMKRDLEEESWVCIHGRPFFHDLVTVPETEQEALQIMSNSC